MTPDRMAIACKYFMSKLAPDEQSELQQLLGGEEIPDLAEDAMKGRLSFDRLPPRLMRQVTARTAPKASAADEERRKSMFPHANRLR